MRPRLLILVLAVAGLARADDKKAVVVAPPDEAVAAARSDLEALKHSASAGGLDAKLPGLAAPELSAGALPAPAYDPGAAAAPLPPKDANWLVDGVMGTDPNARGSQPGAPLTAEQARALILKQTLQKEAPATGGHAAPAPADDYGLAEPDQPAPAPVPPASKAQNPLNAFMASWISASDQVVLRPVLVPKEDTAMGPTPLAGPASADPAVVAGDSRGPAGPVDLKPADNPFLESITPPPVTLSPPPEVTYHPAPLPDVNLAAPRPAPAPNRSAIPDYAKGLEEDPALKQAKRF